MKTKVKKSKLAERINTLGARIEIHEVELPKQIRQLRERIELLEGIIIAIAPDEAHKRGLFPF